MLKNRFAFVGRFPSRIAAMLLLLLGCVFLLTRSNLGHIDKYYSFSDNLTEDYPMQRYFHDRLSEGDLPLWNSHQSGGNPLIGTLQHRLIYPPRLILASLLGVNRGQFMEILFHFFLGIFGTFGLLRAFRLKAWAAFAGTLCVMLSAEFIGVFDNLQGHVGAMVWIPVCMYAVRLFAFKANLARAGFLAFCFAMLVYAGYAQYTFFGIHSSIIVFAGTVFQYRRRTLMHWKRFATLLAFSILLFACLAGPQIITTGEFFAEGIRGHAGVTLDQFLPYPQKLWQIIPHTFAGQTDRVQIHLLSLMIVLGFAIGWMRLPGHRYPILIMILVIIPFAGLAMGNATPMAEWFFRHYPLGSVFRLPHRAQCVLLFPFAFGIGLLAQSAMRFSARRITWIIYVLCILLPLIVAIPAKRLNTQAFIHVSDYMDSFATGVRNAIPAGSNERFDTICGGMFVEPCQKAGMISQRNQLSDYDPSNSYRTYLQARLVSQKLRNSASTDIWLGDTLLTLDTLKDQQALKHLQSASVGWLLVDSFRWNEMKPEERRRILTNSGLSHEGILGNREILLNSMNKEMLGMFSAHLHGDLSLYHILRLKGATPRAYLTNKFVAAKDADDAAKLLATTDPTQVSVLEIPPILKPDPSKQDSSDHLKPATFITDRPEQVILTAKSNGEAFLILNDKFFPGWQCKVNGVPAQIFAANIAFRAVHLQPGENTIEFAYRPPMVAQALIVSALGYIFLLAIAFLTYRKCFFKR